MPTGAWDARTEIAARPSLGGVAVTVVDEAEINVRGILDEMGKNPGQYGAAGRQIGDFYASWMDVEGIEARGTAPLKPYLDRIAAGEGPGRAPGAVRLA
jgi:endothelin-converting enzyme/putative endopeptidase